MKWPKSHTSLMLRAKIGLTLEITYFNQYIMEKHFTTYLPQIPAGFAPIRASIHQLLVKLP